jgi:hypothetical protein
VAPETQHHQRRHPPQLPQPPGTYASTPPTTGDVPTTDHSAPLIAQKVFFKELYKQRAVLLHAANEWREASEAEARQHRVEEDAEYLRLLAEDQRKALEAQHRAEEEEVVAHREEEHRQAQEHRRRREEHQRRHAAREKRRERAHLEQEHRERECLEEECREYERLEQERHAREQEALRQKAATEAAARCCDGTQTSGAWECVTNCDTVATNPKSKIYLVAGWALSLSYRNVEYLPRLETVR